MRKPIVNRTHENDEDTEVCVVLSCGFAVRFWVPGLSDAEYIRRAKQIKRIEARENQMSDRP